MHKEWDARNAYILKPDGDMTSGDEMLSKGHRQPCPKCGVEMLRYKNLTQELRAKTPNEVLCSVNHIMPKSKYPELTYEYSNLEVICRKCNISRSNDTFYEMRQRVKEIDNLLEDFLAETEIQPAND